MVPALKGAPPETVTAVVMSLVLAVSVPPAVIAKAEMAVSSPAARGVTSETPPGPLAVSEMSAAAAPGGRQLVVEAEPP